MRVNGLIGLCLAAAAGFAAAGCAEILGLEPSDAGPGSGGSGAGAPGGSGGSGAGNTASNTGGSGASTASSTGGGPTGGSDPGIEVLTFGGSGEEYTLAVTAGSNGGALAGGQFAGTAAFGPSLSLTAGVKADGFVFQASPSLDVLAAAAVGSNGSNDGMQVVTAVAVSGTGKLAVAGYFDGELKLGAAAPVTSEPDDFVDGFVAYYNSDGTVQWVMRFGGMDNDAATGIAFLPDGNLVVSGNVQGAAQVDASTVLSYGGYDAVLLKIDTGSGKVEWVNHFGGTGDDFAWGVATDAVTGQIAVAGQFEGTMTFQDSSTLTSASGSIDAYAALFGSNGVDLWQTSMGDAQQQRALAVAIDPAESNIIVAGSYSGKLNGQLDFLGDENTPDTFVTKLTPDKGDLAWSIGFTDTGLHQGAQLGVAARGKQIAVAGGFISGAKFDSGTVPATGVDGFVVTLDSDGNYSAGHFISGPGEDRAHAVAIGPSGEVFAVGEFAGTAKINNQPHTSAGATDGFLMRIAGP